MDETASEVWQAPFYELYVQFAGHSPERVAAALEALWRDETVSGPYARDDICFVGQSPVAPRSGFDPSGDSPIHLFGMARLPDGGSVVCGSVAHVRVTGDDGLTFYLPWGSLDRLGRDFQWEDGAQDSAWWSSVDAWLAGLGRRIFDAAPFAVAAVGPEWLTFEAAGDIQAGHLAELVNPPGLLIPADGHLSWVPMH
jgi:hypothetical protein